MKDGYTLTYTTNHLYQNTLVNIKRFPLKIICIPLVKYSIERVMMTSDSIEGWIILKQMLLLKRIGYGNTTQNEIIM